ncbi:response regulator receiver domain-containing protein [Larkinella arboricola]|uniref:Response regulator receiver domain-containing protein n=1 Tax=Larkinella arboricola TaxID=643671 RepID=A0A327WJG8_LARAB|nr:response regulator [Larkinella arboricola]RAJ90022.1 response regulator receiver domain-containing protein [Larkinella arboricola]
MKIAIVDDDHLFQFMTHKLIERIAPGHQLLGFQDGQPALDFIQANQSHLQRLPELILLDINMPLLNGWQFLEGLKQLEATTYRPRIYMVSSSIDPADVLKSQTYAQVKGYLTKPLSKQQLTELLSDPIRE